MKKGLIAVVAVAALVVAFVWGANTGARLQQLGMAQYRAAIAYGHIKQFDKDPKVLRDMLEDDVDSELIDHGEYRKSQLKWLLPSLEVPNDKYAKMVAFYRLDHPHEIDRSFIALYGRTGGKAVADELSEGLAERQKELRAVLDYYEGQRGSSPQQSGPPPSLQGESQQ